MKRAAAIAWSLALVLWAGALGFLCDGCGASAVGTNARAATVATVALQGVHRLAAEGERTELAACAGVPCTHEVETRWAPIGLAHDATRAAIAGWLEALEVARLADAGADLWSPLAIMAARYLAQWDALVLALHSVGVDVPPLPPFVRELVLHVGAP